MHFFHTFIIFQSLEESVLEGAQADDMDSNFILKICDQDIVNKNLLGTFTPMFETILNKPDMYANENLQAATTLTMMRYMILSDTFCRNNIRLMITILEKTHYTSVKNNILISLADLLHRFPNTIEPWNRYFYKW